MIILFIQILFRIFQSFFKNNKEKTLRSQKILLKKKFGIVMPLFQVI